MSPAERICPCMFGLKTLTAEINKKEVNPYGNIFDFATTICERCGRWLGDSNPVPNETSLSCDNPTKRINIQEIGCSCDNVCDGKHPTPYPLDSETPSNITGEHCLNCARALWVTTKVFPYTAENLGACKT